MLVMFHASSIAVELTFVKSEAMLRPAMAYWLFKTEPETYSFEQLQKDRETNWDQVRNFQARNFLKEVKKGDLALIYHSGDGKEIVGVAEVIKEAYPDIDPETPGEWVQIDLKFSERLKEPVTLAALKKDPTFKELKLIKQSRLSCMPVTDTHFKKILKMGGL